MPFSSYRHQTSIIPKYQPYKSTYAVKGVPIKNTVSLQKSSEVKQAI
jgi:hypothetical protein